MGEFPHKMEYLIPIVLNIIVLVVTFVFNGLASTGPNAIFKSQTGDVSDAYYLEITPAGWTFSIWGVIYAWQVVWIAYGLSTICRKGVNGYLYYSPPIMPPSLYVAFTISSLLNITWLILWDREYMPYALVVLASISASLAVALFISYRAVFLNYVVLVQHGLTKEIWWIRWTVQNGIAFYTAWTCIATLLNFAVVLTYWANLDQSHSSTISLSILALELVGWFILDICFLDRYGVRYTFSPYIVVVWALSGIIAKNYQAGEINSIFSLVLLIVGAVALIVKIIVMVVRHFKGKETVLRSTLDEKLTNINTN